MADFDKINDEALEDVTGGEERTVHNDTVNYANVRQNPGLSASIIGTVYNGTKVCTTGKRATKDGFVWCEIYFGSGLGWIAAHLIGY